MSKVSWPSEGDVLMQGRVAALIELGAGFHPELTGRENVFLNGAILGMSRVELQNRYREIVEFAELERFMDTPVKRYSSGMYARLAFAVAAHVQPDVLLVDEVLAVGDQNFQRKCFDFIRDFVKSNKTAVFVSHNLYALEQLCSRLIWLDSGSIIDQGRPRQILHRYLDEQDKRLRLQLAKTIDGAVLQIKRVFVSHDGTEPCNQITLGEDLWIHIDCYVPQAIDRPHFGLAVWTSDTNQPLIKVSMLTDGHAPSSLQGEETIICRIVCPPLMPRTYILWCEIFGADRQTIILPWQPIGAFDIKPVSGSGIDKSESVRDTRADAPVYVDYSWQVRTASSRESWART